MKKRLVAFILAGITVFSLTSCGKKAEEPIVEEEEVSVEPEVFYANPYTGEETLKQEELNVRPTMVMINNITVAQSVQTSVPEADIVFETEVEGGITRLCALFRDVTKIGEIGSVRSARYPYVDLALGYDAIYTHCGRDPVYALPHINTSGVTDFDINSGKPANYGFRKSNGLSSEHTMYTSGAKLKEGYEALGVRMTTDRTGNYFNFSKEAVNFSVLDENGNETHSAKKVKVPFSNAFNSVFTFDEATGLYTKSQNSSSANVDYLTKAQYKFKNVFVLSTSIAPYPDGKHMKVALEGGSGYYITNGTYTKITWKKGAANNPIKVYTEDGNELNVNTGKSWVCINRKEFKPTFE